MKNEIIIYQAEEVATHVEVRIEDETVWLNRKQISSLFDRDVKTIGKHINNIFLEGELDKFSTVAFFATVEQEGNRLIEIQLKTNLTPNQGIFFDGQVFDAYLFVSEIIKNAKTDIILIDNYIDETVLTQLSKRSKDVSATIYTNRISKQLQLDLDKHNCQYPHIQIKQINDCHDRFLIIDQNELYHIGASLKDLGKKWFAFSRMNSLTESLLKMLKI